MYGTIAWYVFPYTLPYLLYTWAIGHLSRILGREDCYNEISPGPLRDGSLLDAAYQTRSAARGLIRFTIFNDVGAARRLHR